MNRQLLEELWSAAMAHAVLICGEPLTDDGSDAPPPQDDATLIRIVTEYLKNTL